jgi:hypothetical protein
VRGEGREGGGLRAMWRAILVRGRGDAMVGGGWPSALRGRPPPRTPSPRASSPRAFGHPTASLLQRDVQPSTCAPRPINPLGYAPVIDADGISGMPQPGTCIARDGSIVIARADAIQSTCPSQAGFDGVRPRRTPSLGPRNPRNSLNSRNSWDPPDSLNLRDPRDPPGIQPPLNSELIARGVRGSGDASGPPPDSMRTPPLNLPLSPRDPTSLISQFHIEGRGLPARSERTPRELSSWVMGHESRAMSPRWTENAHTIGRVEG